MNKLDALEKLKRVDWLIDVYLKQDSKFDGSWRIHEAYELIMDVHKKNPSVIMDEDMEYLWDHLIFCYEDEDDEKLVEMLKARAETTEYGDDYAELGWVLYQMDRNQEAKDALEKAIDLEPHDSENHYRYSLALVDLKLFDQALAAIEKALEIEPNDELFLVHKNDIITFIKLNKGRKKSSGKATSKVGNLIRVDFGG